MDQGHAITGQAAPEHLQKTATLKISATTGQYTQADAQFRVYSPLHSAEAPHREWPNLITLELSEIKLYILQLSERCGATRENFKAALVALETTTRLFLHPHLPMSGDKVIEYLQTHGTTQAAGHAIFAPMELYRNTITTTRFLVSDMIDLLPNTNTVRMRIEKQSSTELKSAFQKENDIRQVLGSLVNGVSRGNEKASLETYLGCLRERLTILEKEEELFIGWAAECTEDLRGHVAREIVDEDGAISVWQLCGYEMNL